MDILPSTFINYLNNCHKGYKMIIYVLVRPETEYSNTFKMVLLIYSGKNLSTRVVAGNGRIWSCGGQCKSAFKTKDDWLLD